MAPISLNPMGTFPFATSATWPLHSLLRILCHHSFLVLHSIPCLFIGFFPYPPQQMLSLQRSWYQPLFFCPYRLSLSNLGQHPSFNYSMKVKVSWLSYFLIGRHIFTFLLHISIQTQAVWYSNPYIPSLLLQNPSHSIRDLDSLPTLH